MRKTDEELEEIARAFLKRMGIEHQVRPDLLTIITKIKHANRAFNYERVPDHEMPDAEAQWDSDKCVLRMRESVFVGMQRNEPRARMTVAHELSHVILGHAGLLNRSTVKSASEIAVDRIRHQELEASRLAPVLLSPEFQVPEQGVVDALMDNHGLSAEAAGYRSAKIEAIRRRRRGEKQPLPRSVVDFLREAQRRGADVRMDLDD
jgi:Zn-dependent peptidase ImmA (M78 family)